MRPLPLVARGLVIAFTVSGVLHLVRPAVFEPIMPRFLPRARELVTVSGVAELLCAAGMLIPATRRLAGIGSAALLVAVLPANIQMAWDMVARVRRKGATTKRVVFALGAIARLPLQWPLITAALAASRTVARSR